MRATELIKKASICHNESDLTKRCPNYLKERLYKNEKILRAYKKSFEIVDLNDDDSLYSLWVLKERQEILTLIAERLLDSVEMPENYESMSKIYDIIFDIEKSSRILGKKIKYDMFRVRTGRLVTKNDSFPILNLPRNKRYCIEPKKDFLVEFDYNAMDLRVLLGLSETQQPDVDIHDWIRKEVFSGQISREESKKKVFSWLYGKKIAEAPRFEKIFSKENICNKFYKDGEIINLYKRKIQ